MSDTALRTAGLSGDYGWNETEDRRLGGVSTALLMVTTSMYFAMLWLLGGVPPLAFLVRLWRSQQP